VGAGVGVGVGVGVGDGVGVGAGEGSYENDIELLDVPSLFLTMATGYDVERPDSEDDDGT
jgi:hypothetical protein